MAGGLDSFDWLKDRIKRPKVVVDLSQIKELQRRSRRRRRPRDRRDDDADRSGAASGGAARSTASCRRRPKRRPPRRSATRGPSAATCRRTRAAGITAAAGRAIARAATSATPIRRRRLNREHAILGADRCVAVNPSDTAPALIALDAQIGDPQPERRARGRTPRTISSVPASTSRA